MAARSTARKNKSTRRQRAQQQAKKQPVTKQTASAAEPVQSASAKTRVYTLSPAWHLLRRSIGMLTSHWRFWAVFCVVFAVLNILLVHNFSTDVVALKDNVASFLGATSPITGIGTYALLVADNTAAPGATAAFQYALLIIASLAAIWAFRQFMSDTAPERLRVRDSLYRGLYPLVPFILILVVLFVELVPLMIAGSVYSIAVSGEVARTGVEQFMFLLLFLAGATLSAWLFVRNVFALYIVTLAGMQPVEALRDAVRIVNGRKLGVIRRLLFLLLVLLLGSLLILLPIILFATPLTQPVFFILTIIALPFIHSYMYCLYRELLG